MRRPLKEEILHVESKRQCDQGRANKVTQRAGWAIKSALQRSLSLLCWSWRLQAALGGRIKALNANSKVASRVTKINHILMKYVRNQNQSKIHAEQYFSLVRAWYVLPVCLSSLFMQCPQKPEDGAGSLGNRLRDGCGPLSGCWKLDQSLLEGQPVILTTEPPLQPYIHNFKR